MNQDRALPQWARLAFWATMTLLAVRFVDLYAVLELQSPSAPLELLLAGEAATPFQYRLFSVAGIGLLERLPGVGLSSAAAIWSLAWLLAFLVALFALLQRVLADRRLVYLFTGLVFYPLLTIYVSLEYLRFYYPWDLPQVALTTLAALLLLERRWAAYLTVFAVATLNRETSFLLLFLSLAAGWDTLPRGRLLALLAAQTAFWAAAKAALFVAFADNPGFGLAANTVVENLFALLHHPADGLTLLLFMGAAWVPVLLAWRRLQVPLLRRGLLACGAHFAIALFTAYIYEVRVFGEYLPLLWPAFAWLVARWLGLQPTPDSAASR